MKKIVSYFDRHGPVFLRAVLQDNTQVAVLSRHLTLPRQQLCEVYLMAEDESALTSVFLAQAGFQKDVDLLSYYQVERSGMPKHATTKEIELLAAFLPGLEIEDAVFDFSLQPTAFGSVISAVFGSHSGMNAMYDNGLRKRVVEEVDDEPST